MKRDLAMSFSRVTEGAALAGYKWLGRGDKNAADGAAVEVMRSLLNKTEISGEIVIGEGEIDDAPMLYIGENVGTGGDAVDIAVDPIEGARMTAMGQSNALAVLTAGEKGSFLKAPDMYMEKLVVGSGAKGDIEENRKHGELELERCAEMGVTAGIVLKMEDMARSDNVVFSATGITKGDLLEGITRTANIATTETLLIRGRCRTIRRIKSIHYLERKDPEVIGHIL